VAVCAVVSQSAPEFEAEDAILDAARATVLDFGVRRTTVSEVARRAGVSRMTVYRRHPDGAALLRALMAREFGGVIEQSERETAWLGTERERLVATVIRGVDLLATNAVLLRILELDADRLLPYFTGAPGRFQRLAREVVRERVEAGQEEGSVRDGEPERLAASVELALRGAVLAARGMDAGERAESLRELARMLDGYLRPPA
jgi:AcrR family transcriptional regulator